jgi:Fe2+ or Zn2+ uptake regulation protein
MREVKFPDMRPGERLDVQHYYWRSVSAPGHKLTPTARKVLKILLQRRKAGTREMPTREVLVQRTGSSPYTIATALNQLTRHKIIIVG